MWPALRGVRVVDLTRILAGPFGAMLLGDLGADVLKLERPEGGDDTRAMGPHFLGGESAYFLSVNRNKRSLCVDLTTEAGRELLWALCEKADVLLENFRFGVAERLGCDAATLHARAPRLVVCGLTAFGRTGPDRTQPAFDLTLQARGGTMGLTGEAGRIPVRCGPPIGDLAGGLYSALAVTAALYERERTGRGSFVDLSLLDCQVSLLTYAASFYLNAGAVLGPQGSAHAHATPYQCFATADGALAVAVFTDRFWPGFCRVLGFEAWASDPDLATHAQRRARWTELLPALEARLRASTTRAWVEALNRAEIPCAPVQSVAEVFADPQVLARDMVETFEHPAAGTIRVAASPLRGDTAEPDRAPPTLGQHTVEALREWLGWDEARIEHARRRGAFGSLAP